MVRVFYFSGSGHSKAVAEHFAQKLNADNISIVRNQDAMNLSCTTAVVVFPVYCQNLPEPVKEFLQNLKSEYVVLIATYGKMGHGNVLWEAKQLVKGTTIAGAYVPTGHTYLNEPAFFCSNELDVIFDRIANPVKALIPKKRKVFFADFFPGLRSRISVKLVKNKNCNSCGHCADICPMQAIRNGKANSRCIRCLHCVSQCPQSALDFELSRILKKYLSKKRESTLKIYL